jgi:hypothetical protein
MRSQFELYVWSLPVRSGGLGDGHYCQSVGHDFRDLIGITSPVLPPLRRIVRRPKTLALPVAQPSDQHPERRRAVAVPAVRIDLDVHSAQGRSWGRDQRRFYQCVSSSAFGIEALWCLRQLMRMGIYWLTPVTTRCATAGEERRGYRHEPGATTGGWQGNLQCSIHCTLRICQPDTPNISYGNDTYGSGGIGWDQRFGDVIASQPCPSAVLASDLKLKLPALICRYGKLVDLPGLRVIGRNCSTL